MQSRKIQTVSEQRQNIIEAVSLDSELPALHLPCLVNMAVIFIYFAHFMQDPPNSGWRLGGNKSVRCHLAPLPFAWHLRVLRHF